MLELKAEKGSFDALIDFLEANGNPVLGKRWRGDKEGYHTYMTLPIDFALIASNFFVANDVILYERYQTITTAQEWLDVKYCHGLAYDPSKDGYGGAYYYVRDETA